MCGVGWGGGGGRKEGGREEEEEDQGPGGGDGKAAMRQQDTGATGVVGVVEARAIWLPVLVLSHRLLPLIVCTRGHRATSEVIADGAGRLFSGGRNSSTFYRQLAVFLIKLSSSAATL